ncbi:ABC transporter ATP-binding protein [Mesorhizobium sp. L-8-3]|uniref:ABC transporter ATP-binding protein n=1 Tax=Mesorhizobium sp. L-8-3 TaxID=2744522 RepID=UPI0019290BB2|nr:sn-glycerol-3-phosphate ABC transporter ATP-binding protein UgpC [Mesorhizobium sp. L-8-3]BCH27890.1 sn-glycerol-3-phosphate import ATP-binding protein UgpC 2 [Mesorhizobium sp. L-8-3]
MTSANIILDNVRKSYGTVQVIPGLSAEIEAGSFTVILGPSGCGKSTLLNMLAGLEEISGGRILIGGREVQNTPPKDRGLAMVFQNYALYPHMTVAQNIGYALKVAGVPKTDRARRVREAADFVELGAYLDRRPGQLSGGQRQRVAIARAIVREPQVLLYDEPLSNLDAKLRHGMRMELSQLHTRIGATSVFVTHDQVEAMTLADRIMILNAGRIEQYGTPQEIYHKPASVFVAGFIGAPPMNLLDGVVEKGTLIFEKTTLGQTEARDGPVKIGVRPEKTLLGQIGPEATTVYAEDLGSHRIVVVKAANGQQLQISTTQTAELSDSLTIGLPPESIHLFDVASGARLEHEVRASNPRLSSRLRKAGEL